MFPGQVAQLGTVMLFQKLAQKAITRRDIGTTGDGTRIVMVEGAEIRNLLDVEYGLGAHHLCREYVPENEIWIERLPDVQDMEANLAHELVEYFLMKYTGMEYREAHQRAQIIEQKYRKLTTAGKIKAAALRKKALNLASFERYLARASLKPFRGGLSRLSSFARDRLMSQAARNWSRAAPLTLKNVFIRGRNAVQRVLSPLAQAGRFTAEKMRNLGLHVRGFFSRAPGSAEGMAARGLGGARTAMLPPSRAVPIPRPAARYALDDTLVASASPFERTWVAQGTPGRGLLGPARGGSVVAPASGGTNAVAFPNADMGQLIAPRGVADPLGTNMMAIPEPNGMLGKAYFGQRNPAELAQALREAQTLFRQAPLPPQFRALGQFAGRPVAPTFEMASVWRSPPQNYFPSASRGTTK